MLRRARVSLPGLSLYLIQRRNNRSACFYADEDYLFLVDQACSFVGHARKP